MSARMKSSSADPDFVEMLRFKAAMEAWLRPAWPLVRERPDEVAAFEDGLQRVPDQRIAFPHDLQEACAARWRSQVPGDVDEQPPAGLVHGPACRQLPQGEPQGLHS